MDKTRKYLFASVIILVVVSLIWAYKKGKNKGTTYQLPGGDTVAPDFDPAPIAEQAFSAFDGIDWSYKKKDVLETLESLTDAELILVYNYFNKELAEPSETLLSYIKDEWIFGDLVNDVIARLENLGAV